MAWYTSLAYVFGLFGEKIGMIMPNAQRIETNTFPVNDTIEPE